MRRAAQPRLSAAGVTEREAETLAAVGRRLTNREIAGEMMISVRTVESHVSSLLRKLGLPDRPALVRLASQLPGEFALPSPATSLVGRDADLAELSALLDAGTLVTLAGPAGCGKTRLATEAARRWRGEARMVDLSPASARDVSALVTSGLGVGYEARDIATAARVAIAGRDLLLVADNCEHVADAAREVLGELAGAVPGVRILATSREPLGLAAEHVLTVRPLGLPPGTRPADVLASSAGQLFLDRARAAAPGFVLSEASSPQVAAICQRLDGLPLALELAAACVRNLDVTEFAEGLRDRFDLLGRPSRPGRHGSLSSAIEWSWRLLRDDERRLLCRLAALPGEFTVQLAEAVSPGLPAADVRGVLMRLVERSLVSVRLGEGAPARYWLLGVIRAFARERAAGEDLERGARAHALYFRAAAKDAVRARYQPRSAGRPPPGFDEANLLAALTWSARHDPALADDLLLSLSQLVETEPSRQALDVISDLASRRPPDWSSEALARAGQVVSYLSLDQAERLASASASAAVSDRDRAFASLIAGWVHAYRRAEKAAESCLDAAIAYARRAGEPWLEGSALQARGVAREAARDSFADWEQAVAGFVAAGDLMHANNVRYMLASRAVETRTRMTDVPVWLAACEAYASGHGLRHELAHIRRARAGYERARGNAAAARELLNEALPVFREAGDFRCVARTLLELAVPPLNDDPATAKELLLACLPAAALAGGPALQADALTRLVISADLAGDPVLAARCLGALDALGAAPEPDAGPDGAPPLGAGLTRDLREPVYATFVAEGRAGGVDVITALYPR